MSNTTTALATQPPAVMEATKGEIVFVPFGSEDKVKLSIAIVKNYIAVPYIGQQNGQQATYLPDDRECMRFMMLLRSRRLNPFEGDAYMIPFWDKRTNGPQWALVTGIEAFRKRAELHPQFDGIASGVIVKTDGGEVLEREGDFLWPGDELLGGWARVQFKQRTLPTIRRLNVATFKKPFGQWVTDPAGMIVTRAESHALRDSFPTLLGGVQLREEITDIEATVTAIQDRRPQYAQGLPAPDMATQRSIAPSSKVAGPSADKATQPKAAKPATRPAPTVAPPVVVPSKPEPTQTEPTPTDTEADNTAEAALESGPNAGPSEAELGPVGDPDQPPAEAASSTPEKEPDPAMADAPIDHAEVKQIKALCRAAGVSMAQIMGWLVLKNLASSGQHLGDVLPAKRQAIIRLWATKVAEIQAIK